MSLCSYEHPFRCAQLSRIRTHALHSFALTIFQFLRHVFPLDTAVYRCSAPATFFSCSACFSPPGCGGQRTTNDERDRCALRRLYLEHTSLGKASEDFISNGVLSNRCLALVTLRGFRLGVSFARLGMPPQVSHSDHDTDRSRSTGCGSSSSPIQYRLGVVVVSEGAACPHGADHDLDRSRSTSLVQTPPYIDWFFGLRWGLEGRLVHFGQVAIWTAHDLDPVHVSPFVVCCAKSVSWRPLPGTICSARSVLYRPHDPRHTWTRSSTGKSVQVACNKGSICAM